MEEHLQKSIEDVFNQSGLNRLPKQFGHGRIFSTPLLGVAAGDDPIFLKYKELVHFQHLTPSEMWVKSRLADSNDLVPPLRIVSIIFPYEKRIRDENKGQRTMPADIYCMARNFGHAFMNEVLRQTIGFFQKQGYRGVAGLLSPAYQIIELEGDFASTWSERHMAFAAGLGTFSLKGDLITDAGCNARIASVLTDAPLQVTPRRSDSPYGNCLYYAKGNCKECAKRCPASAISDGGHDKGRCYAYRLRVAKEMDKRLGSLLRPHYWDVDRHGIFYEVARGINRRLRSLLKPTYRPVGCALCQFDVPCTERNPLASPDK
jgi:epoxyqueuosine reductase